MAMEHTNPDVERLITDEYFIRWVKNPDQQTQAYWQLFLEKNPDQQQAAAEARIIVSAIHFQTFEPTPEQITQMYQHIRQGVDPARMHTLPRQTRPLGRHTGRRLRTWQRTWLAAAAIIGAALVGGWWLWMIYQGGSPAFATNPGQIRKVRLEDGTSVTLNGNSRLVVAKHFSGNPDRQVSVEGEAFFEVAKHTGSAFTVKTNSGLSIKVLGTVFNVNTRQQKASVLLAEGKVQLSTPTGQIQMKPGELAVYNPAAKTLKLSKVPANSVAWINGMIVLDNLTLKEILAYVNDTYGVQVSVKDPALLNKGLLGRMAINDLDVFLENLATSLDVQVHKVAKDQYLLQ
jgi:ferric-dicitrate binding protein FerR (iron transport regulator)